MLKNLYVSFNKTMAKFLKSIRLPTNETKRASNYFIKHNKPFDTNIFSITDDGYDNESKSIQIKSSFTENNLQLLHENGLYKGLIYSCTKFNEDQLVHFYVSAVVRSSSGSDLKYFLIDNPNIFTYTETNKPYELYFSDIMIDNLSRKHILVDKNWSMNL